MVIRKATLDDVELLVRLRLDFLIMNGANLSAGEKTAIVSQLRHYYMKHIPLGDFIAHVAEEERQVLSAAFMVIGERPANTSFITGITATLLNVITYPEYRKTGCATRVIQSLIREVKESGVSAIDLNATEMGKGLYLPLSGLTICD